MEILARKKRRPMSEINVVPYIDVMLVLLIVFMITAPLLNQGIEVELPEANNEPLDLDENLETLVVTITSAGEYFLSLGATGEDRQSLDLETVARQTGQILNANPTVQVLIEGDTNATWGAMINLITALQNAGVENPNFITQPLTEL
ncbi:MAG: ExbD/TolR family protein [Gammaproteobacteria bacterium]|nr:ExbD/TolR family protein [Gammaproteobacteria bacterium]MDE0478440.1 ExbD/TolR family protein [Gammaproteobacteria bacterium]MDE0509734.1 ExbD/TolR family protein [Gammaproteobacteria bacterium]MXZ33391.1 ExbD/TolR family protein [Gammaproteobacteria bacterium]MYF00508.1 ExbD/TolR family protein [Gammaproteobacteria bacterium]